MRLPMRQYMLVTSPGGKTYRWGEDEPGADRVFEDLRDSDAVPGGCKELSCSLPRKPGVDYGDMQRGSKVELFGAGQYKVWEGTLQDAPRSSGDRLVMDPAAVGYQSHLSDDESAQCIPINRDLSELQGPGTARQDAIRSIGFHPEAPSVSPDVSNGMPSAISSTVGPITKPFWEMHLDGGGVPIGRIRFRYSSIGIGTHGSDPNVTCDVYTDDNDVFGSGTLVKSDFSTPGSYDIPIPSPEQFVLLYMYYGGSGAGATGVEYGVRISELAYFDNSGIPVQGAWPTMGVLASDVIAYALARWAPLLNFTTGAFGSIRPSTFPIPHLEFKEQTTVEDIVAKSNRFELNEWAVWPGQFGPTFYMNPRGQREGRKRWRGRVGPTQLRETGQSMKRVFNGVLVQYQDVDGSTRVIGPPGSGCRLTSSRLVDADPLNPANQIPGLRKWTKISLKRVATNLGAEEAGERFLEQTKLLDGSGEATLTGFVEDEYGAEWPYYYVKAGDLFDPIDSSTPGYRYIVSANRGRSTRSNAIALDAPPDSYEALLERLDVEEMGIG